jgi:hypothetical protein
VDKTRCFRNAAKTLLPSVKFFDIRDEFRAAITLIIVLPVEDHWQWPGFHAAPEESGIDA